MLRNPDLQNDRKKVTDNMDNSDNVRVIAASEVVHTPPIHVRTSENSIPGQSNLTPQRSNTPIYPATVHYQQDQIELAKRGLDIHVESSNC